ncbi:Cyclohexanone monooxygenase [Euzebya pacifica]|uniref:Cyclohexanone monooxygenase n=2 Tax=Euzebya pacifica TaxID=1608957 RepID=A0A346Y4L6_9ACTN|nr:Cyclohexanone monooxygenase [Euzebya pacifica]
MSGHRFGTITPTPYRALMPEPTTSSSARSARHERSPRILVIGAGFGGLGLAMALRRAGHDRVTILERADDVGGVWRDNTYPQAACDVPSSLYSWSFAPQPTWSRRYSQQPDILSYIRRTAEEEGVLATVRTGVEVTAATFDDATRVWHVDTASGERFEAEVLVPAVGQLSQPSIPSIPGAEAFAGTAFHSARWRHDVDLTGKRVAVVGTGASAIQFVPGIVDDVGAMTVFQRSAPYVVPKPDRAYTGLHHRAFERWPATQQVGRRLTRSLSEWFNRSFEQGGVLQPVLRATWQATLWAQVRDADLRVRLVPDYPLGCKRVLFSNDWYPALDRDHVDVVTDDIVEVRPEGLVTADGRLHEADVIIWGTGFAATRFLDGIDVTGREGLDLHGVWADGARAHLGLAVPGFPQLFVMYGPNTNLGGSSIIQMLEAQASWIVQVVDAIAEGRVGCVDVRADVAGAYDAEMQERLGESIWSACTSWYTDGGRITTNWPGLVAEYERRLARVDFDELVDVAVPATAGGAL